MRKFTNNALLMIVLGLLCLAGAVYFFITFSWK